MMLDVYFIVSNDGKVHSVELSETWMQSRLNGLNEEFEGTSRKWRGVRMEAELPKELFTQLFDDPPPKVSIATRFFKLFN